MSGLTCPACGGRTHVVDSRQKFGKILRRRECLACAEKFTSEEAFVADKLVSGPPRKKLSLVEERTAQLIAHRACCNEEHDIENGKLAGFCVVCGVPWPCEYAGLPPEVEKKHEAAS